VKTQPTPFPQRLCNLVDARLSDPLLNVDELARSLGLSRRHLLRRSRSHFGEVPSRLLLRRRLQLGRSLIANGGWNRVQDVAARVGMSPKAFSRQYRSEFGESPGRTIRRRANRPPSASFPPLPSVPRDAS